MSELAQEAHTTPVQNLQRMIEADAQVLGYHSDVHDGPEGVYVSAALPESALNMEFRGIVPEQSLSLEATDSHHEVCFATVSTTNARGVDSEVVVGVKHFDDALQNAVSEHDSLVAVRELGFEAIVPLAIVKESETSSYLITLYRPDIRSLDNANWSVRPGERDFDKVVENLNFIGEAMGSMHAKGVFHGDAQPKNFTRSDTGKAVVIDLETGCKIAETPEEHVEAYNVTEDAVQGSALHDLNLFWKTLNRPIGLHPKNMFLGEEAEPTELYSVFRDGFITPYLTKLEADCDPAVFAQLKVTEVVAQLESQVRSQLGLEVLQNPKA